MTCRRCTVSLACLIGLAVLALAAFPEAGAQEEKKKAVGQEKKAEKKTETKEKKADQEKKPAQEPEAAGGPELEVLKHFVGTWEATISMQPPGAPAQESKGAETSTLGCGGLWLISDFKGEFAGMPFHGHGLQGYDPDKKKYVGVWVDNTTQRLDISEGDWDAATRTLTAKARTKNPQTGEDMEFTTRNKVIDKDSHVFLMYFPGPDGKEFEAFKITYKRQKK